MIDRQLVRVENDLDLHILDQQRSINENHRQLQPKIYPDEDIRPGEPSVEIWKNETRTHIRERLKRIIPKDKHDLLLEGTGLDVLYQTENIEREFKNQNSLQEIQRVVVQKTAEDLRSFWTEFLMQSPILSYSLAISDGKVIAPNYENEELVTLSSTNQQARNEREGATWEGIIEFANKILTAKPGEIVLLNSPSGWASDDGLKHWEDQTYGAKISQDGSIDAVTFRSDMTLEEAGRFMKGFGADLPTHKQTTKEKIKTMVRTVVVVPKGKELPDILREISKVTGRKDILPGKSFESAFNLLENRNLLHVKNPLVENAVNEIARYVETHLISPDDKVFADFALFLGRKVLELSYSKRAESGEIKVRRRSTVQTENKPRHLSDEALQKEAKFVQQLKGCVSRLQSNVFNKAMQALGLENVKSPDVKILCCTCPVCKQEVMAEIYGGEIHCPNCRATAPYS